MFEYALCGLIFAWLLSIVGFDELFIRFIKEWTGKEVSSATYYVCAFFFGFFIVPIFH